MRKAICPEVLRSKYFTVTLLLFFLIPQAGLAYSTDYRFTGQPYDNSSGLYYFNQRYFDPAAGRFTQSDPLLNYLTDPGFEAKTGMSLEQFLANPQRLNYYAYSGNNPVAFADPSGLLTVVAPGTYYNSEDWQAGGKAEAFINSVAVTFKESRSVQVINDKSVWSGADNSAARAKAAAYIAELINNYQFAAGEQLNIVGFSHGGNIGILAADLAERKTDNLVTLATPVRPDYQPNAQKIGRHVNVYGLFDAAQVMGGGFTSLSRLVGGVLMGVAGSLIGSRMNIMEFGPASRTFKNAVNVNVGNLAGRGLFSSHINFWKNTGIWQKVASYLK